MADSLVCKQTALGHLLDALKHHNKELNYFFSSFVVDLTAYFSHDNLDHAAQHVLLVFNTFAVSYWIRNCLLEHVANRQQHLIQG